jgi:hypothetical protein
VLFNEITCPIDDYRLSTQTVWGGSYRAEYVKCRIAVQHHSSDDRPPVCSAPIFESAEFMTKTRGVVAAAIIMLAGGCGEIAYKTGAGADQLASDQQACKRGDGNTAAYKQCMNGKGWAVANLDGTSQSPAMASATSGSVTVDAPPVSGGGASQAAPPPLRNDPQGTVPISGWVKFGGGGPKDDIDACVATLGPAHQPDTVHRTVTNALLSCMHGKGWRAL